MANADIPSGKDVRDSQANGSSPTREREESPPESEHFFHASAVWNGDGAGAGEMRPGDNTGIAIAGSKELGGSGGASNPEELLLGALAACFVSTWAIFLKKLQISYEQPAIRVSGTLGKDPAGGFHMTGAIVHARVPQPLLSSELTKIEKSLSLAEKYCIISRAVRPGMPVKVEIEAV